jgi:hypothetical protein
LKLARGDSTSIDPPLVSRMSVLPNSQCRRSTTSEFGDEGVGEFDPKAALSFNSHDVSVVIIFFSQVIIVTEVGISKVSK